MIKTKRLAILFSLLTQAIGSAHAASSVPTHCNADEYSVVDAWMGPTHPTSGGYANSRSGKFLSLCADKKTEPFGKFVYRYGNLNQVELEVTATIKDKFGVYSRTTSPHTEDEIIFFTKGKYTYYVVLPGGQGSGISLRVYEGKKLLVNKFSGNYLGLDYSWGPAEMNFSGIASEVFREVEPEHNF
jgi:hypothetical protein